MALKYTPEELVHLRDSPLCVKPPGLPPAEQWMGAPPDTNRNQSARVPVDRTKDHDANPLLEHANRRPRPEKHLSRNSANPEDIILGLPKTAFMSSTSSRNANKVVDSPDRPTLRDNDSRDRFSFRGKTGDGDERPRRDNLRPKRGDGDDSEGWSTVKPRKSFGTEGAERFNGRMGGERHREDRRFKDREDRDTKERPRGFENFSRENKDKDHDQENIRKNGRGRNEPSWFRDNNEGPPTPQNRNSNGDKFGGNRGWREKDQDDRGDRGDRGDRRWDRDRDHRQEREPEWMDEPVEEKGQTHTQEDFQKWKELMAGKDKPAASKPVAEEASPPKVDELPSFFATKPKLAPLPIDTGPDKFFGMWAKPKEEGGLTPALELSKEPSSKSAIPATKSSRFTSFFSQDESARKVEPQTALPGTTNGLESLFSNNNNNSNQSPSEKEAFQALLQKLQRQSMGGTPPVNSSMQPKPPVQEKQPGTPFEGPEPFQQYRPERQDDVRSATRSQPHNIQDLLAQRQSTGSQPSLRPEQNQMLQDLVGQRQNSFSQASIRPDQPQRSAASNTEFLMNLMHSAKAAPDPQRTEQVLLGLPPKQQMNRQLEQQMLEREQLQREVAAQRDRNANQQRRPPGFFDEPAFRPGGPPQHENSRNPPQPTQILQRPPPPGLEHWQGQPPPPQQLRHIAPPPGLAGGAPRGMPIPQGMFPPGFPPMGAPMNNFPGPPPPEALIGPPRNLNMQIPPGYYNAPPPGFPPPGMSPFSAGPEGMAFPFDGRGGPPPPGQGFRR